MMVIATKQRKKERFQVEKTFSSLTSIWLLVKLSVCKCVKFEICDDKPKIFL